MKTKNNNRTSLILTSSILCLGLLTSCDEDKPTVSKNFWGDTVVSHKTGSGTYTRTTYGEDWFSNPKTTVSRGHENATHWGDLIVGILEILAEE